MMKKISKIIIAIMVTTTLAVSTGCASLKREIKTATSDLNGGLHREVIVYDAVGNELFRQVGKFDVDYEAERILYDDESGNRHVIYFKTGTVIVNEIN